MFIISLPKLFYRLGSKPTVIPPLPTVIYPPGLAQIKDWPLHQLPPMVQQCPLSMKYIQMLGQLDWENLPWRPRVAQPGPYPETPIPYIAALLVKEEQQIQGMEKLRQFLIAHPALTWVLGFELQRCQEMPGGVNVAASLPSAAHFSYVLRTLPNALLQFFLTDTVAQLRLSLPEESGFGQAVAIDTKHILAWVKENNPKAYIKEGRLDKTNQPAGDNDCKLGCKRRRNLPPEATPTKEGTPATGKGVGKGEYYWGYASGVVVTKVAGWGEFVLAEMTATFDKSDVTYFVPLMEQVEARLGFAPPFGTADAAYDAWYVYDYFDRAGGFAAIPYVDRTKGRLYQFDEHGLPLCAAQLAMPVKSTFIKQATSVSHECARHMCPIRFSALPGEYCPIGHEKWDTGGCQVTLPTNKGTRLRYQLDRHSQEYKALYKQRTAAERVFSQALALGIERPKVRNQQSITNQNSLIYLLINLRALLRVQEQKQRAIGK